MFLIEPCCAERHVCQLRSILGDDGTREFKGYGDLSLTELLPAILSRYSETEMVIAAPVLPEQATDIIAECMKKQWARKTGTGKLDVIRHMIVVTDKKKSPVAFQWAKDNRFGARLSLVNKQQEGTIILLPDFAITGPINLRYGHSFVATATSDCVKIQELWRQFKEP